MSQLGYEGILEIERLETGVPGLDRLLDGGLTKGGFVLMVGGPGTGKTVLAEQMAFHWAAEGRNVLWLVTLGEPNEKFLTHLSGLQFFDRHQVGTTIQLINLAGFLQQGLQEKLEVIRRTIRSGHYSFAVIDGFQSLRSFLSDPREARFFLSELSSELALMGITLIITADSRPSRYWEGIEFTMADTVIALDRVMVDGRERRELQVLKQRGRQPIGGFHSFSIGDAGVTVHPRAECLLPAGESYDGEARQAFGLPFLDSMLDGGPWEGSTTLIVGSPGTGKSLLASHFLAAGIRERQPGYLLSFFENRDRYLDRAEAFRLPLRQAHETGLLELQLDERLTLDPDTWAEDIQRRVEEAGIRRLVIDGIGPFAKQLAPHGRTVEYLAALSGYLRLRSVTTVITQELGSPLQPEASLPLAGVDRVATNLIWLRFVELEGRLRRFLSVVKTRYSRHSDVTAELIFAEGELNIVAHAGLGEAEIAGAGRGSPFAAQASGHYQT